ncbi:hypothetical protein QKT49_gp072 [Acanthamoeba castellanii medusavirus]|uniref:Uncharacterized protein n=1 Tax=Acanthamoeba castellanii medusavirus J1 TaxID=3114988 RepID=A0A3T1CWK2_9VIRU|nr:hypothetical protein QKT49_gp072 [Acanthamoeba castellanii medusavirus]BBI30212.1 hypothetical protein [Acanthamoeba castellanii medusavirus J1]
MSTPKYVVENILNLPDSAPASATSLLQINTAGDVATSALTVSNLAAASSAGPLFDVWCIGPQDVKGGSGAGNSFDIENYRTDKTAIPSNLSPLTFFNNPGSGLNAVTGHWTVPTSADYWIIVDAVLDPRGPDDGISGPFIDIDGVRTFMDIGNNHGDGAFNQPRQISTAVRLQAGQVLWLKMAGVGTDGVDTEWIRWRVQRTHVPI